jgi:hypothetical protein
MAVRKVSWACAYDGMKRLILIAFIIHLSTTSIRGFCSAQIEPPRTAIQMEYANGEVVRMDCGRRYTGICDLHVREGSHDEKFKIDFKSVEIEPTLDTLVLEVTDPETKDYLVSVGVRCRQSELDLLKEKNGPASECVASFEINSGEIDWRVVSIFPISSASLYNDIR